MSANKDVNETARILIVDDEDSITDLLREMLLLMGHEPHCVNHPAQALTRMEEEHFDLVLSDYRMPGMNGRQFYQAVDERCPRLLKKIVFLTGDVGSDDTRTFLKSVGNYALSKPFQFGEVTALISDLLTSRNPAPAEAYLRA